MPPVLPPELLDRIISSTHRPSQLACAQVCRDWVPASRTAFFSRRIEMLVNAYPEDSHFCNIQIIALLESPLSTLRTYLTNIRLQTIWSQGVPAAQQDTWEKVSAALIVANIHLSALSLSFLDHFVDPSQSIIPESTIPLLHHFAPTIQTFAIELTDWEEGLRIASKLFDKQQLQHLSINTFSPLSHRNAVSLYPIPHSLVSFKTNYVDHALLQLWSRSCTGLSVLTLTTTKGRDVDNLASILSQAVNRSHLDLKLTVVLLPYMVADPVDIGRFLSSRELALCLLSLRIDILGQRRTDRIDLQHATRLQSFTIRLNCFEEHSQVLEGILDSLQTIRPMETLELIFNTLSREEMIALDKILSSFLEMAGGTKVKEIALRNLSQGLLSWEHLPRCADQVAASPNAATFRFAH